MEDLVFKTVHCNLCKHQFKTPRVKRKKQKAITTDPDFCVHYESENPIYYYVAVCPQCGYSFTEAFKRPKKGIEEKVPSLDDDYLRQRDADIAEKSYWRAIECAMVQEERSAVLAGLYHHLAWVYRLKGDKEKEKEALQKAYQYYYTTYQETYAGDTGRIMYLLGEISRRLGNYKEAVFYLSKVANDRTIADPGLTRQAREIWQRAREEYKEETAQEEESPQE